MKRIIWLKRVSKQVMKEYQKDLKCNPKTIVNYPKPSNTTIYEEHCKHPYKSYYNMVAGLFLHYKIPKAAAMLLLK